MKLLTSIMTEQQIYVWKMADRLTLAGDSRQTYSYQLLQAT